MRFAPFDILQAQAAQASSFTKAFQGQINDIVLGVVFGDIAVAPKEIGAGQVAVVVEELFTGSHGLDGAHDEVVFLFE